MQSSTAQSPASSTVGQQPYDQEHLPVYGYDSL